jgi:hypothetical protein
VWEGNDFVGIVIFSRGAAKHLGTPYGLTQTEVCELTRIALRTPHATPVTKIVAVALRMLRAHCPGLRLVVSFADPDEGHHGGIYQGGNWIYTGMSPPSYQWERPDGKRLHARQVTASGVGREFGEKVTTLKPSECRRVSRSGKHRYLMPLDKQTRRKALKLSKPYPKPAQVSSESLANQQGLGGATPTPALHLPTEGADIIVSAPCPDVIESTACAASLD